MKRKLDLLKLERVVGNHWKLTDGAQAVQGPAGIKYIYKSKQPPDFLTYVPKSGQLIFIEAKNINASSASISVQTEEQDRLGKKCSGLKRHQLETLIDAERDGAIALLVVRFETRGVFAMSGMMLRAWEERAFDEEKAKSISWKLFQEYGWFLGEENRWDLKNVILEKAKAPRRR